MPAMFVKLHFSRANQKLQKTEKLHGATIIGWDLPAGMTCPYAGECKKICYAQRGNYRYPSKRDACMDNLIASQQPDFVERMVASIQGFNANNDKKLFIRIHASGDFYSVEYALKWAEIARQCPSVTFYAYTKSVSIVQTVDMPDNVKIAYSLGGLQDYLIPANAHAVAKIFDTEEDALNAGYDIRVNNDDLQVVAGGKLGLIKH